MHRSLLAALMSLLVVTGVAGQEQRGTLEGTVHDAQRGVMPGATVAATNLAQAVTVETFADATGAFRFPALAPGSYDVTASLPGFQSYKFERVEVLLGQVKRLAFVLEIAGVTELSGFGVLAAGGHASERARVQPAAGGHRCPAQGPRFHVLVTQAPSANQEPKLGGISIDGSSAGENRTLVNGMETTTSSAACRDTTSCRSSWTRFR